MPLLFDVPACRYQQSLSRYITCQDVCVQWAMPPLSGVPACRYKQSLSPYITSQDVCIQESHATKRLISYLEVIIWRFVAMLLLHDKDHQWNNPLASLATCPAGSSVASPKMWSPKNLVGTKMFDFRRITLFCLWYRVSKHKWLYVLKICGGDMAY